ncbi:hypothetical protein [Parafrankia sp. FMc2]|uniref:hypothetical protein n=1 Tax=Parafrankia sp. FMc2 TaxID=3233196 RepID=UPI0034D665F4
MNAVFWVLQGALAALQLLSFASMPYLVRHGHARRPVGAAAAATFGLCCGLGLVVPWLTGHAQVLTPIAATATVLAVVYDSVTNRLDTADVAFNTTVLVMAVAVAAGRFHDLASGTAPTLTGQGPLLGGAALLVLTI